MNPGVFLFTVTPQQAAKATVSALANDIETFGHYKHCMQMYI